MAVKLYELPKLLNNPKHTVNSLWGSDAGRNSLSGKYSGTFIGYFDQLELSFGKTTQSEMTTIRNAIETSIVEATFIDSISGNEKTEKFYGGASIVGEKLNKNLYKPFTVTLTAIAKRGDK